MITAIIQARMKSTRLPGKIMIEFSGNTLLGHIIERLKHSGFISKIIVATTHNPADDVVAEWASANAIDYFRGDEADVLNRYYEAAKFFNARHIARITSDDPFKDPQVIDAVVNLYLKESLDFAYNNRPPSFPEGLDTEIFSFQSLETANRDAADPFEREHVTQHFYRNPKKFKQQNLSSLVDYSDLRWTIDTREDLKMTKLVYDHLYRKGQIFLMEDIVKLLAEKPEIKAINQSVSRSDMYKK